MEVNKVLFAVREKIDSLLGETHEEDKESLFETLDELAYLISETVEEERQKAAKEAAPQALVKALREFATWHSAEYEEERMRLGSRTAKSVSDCLWSQVVDVAGPHAGLPSDFPRVLP
jgi:hypothetical protein